MFSVVVKQDQIAGSRLKDRRRDILPVYLPEVTGSFQPA